METDYNLSPAGTIQDCGKFEGEMCYVPMFWDECINGGSDYDDGEVYGVIITAEDRARWPEYLSAEDYGVLMTESDQGFVYADVVSKQEWDKQTA